MYDEYITYKIWVNRLFMLLVKLPVNIRIVVKFWGSQKVICRFFMVWRSASLTFRKLWTFWCKGFGIISVHTQHLAPIWTRKTSLINDYIYNKWKRNKWRKIYIIGANKGWDLIKISCDFFVCVGPTQILSRWSSLKSAVFQLMCASVSPVGL